MTYDILDVHEQKSKKIWRKGKTWGQIVMHSKHHAEITIFSLISHI